MRPARSDLILRVILSRRFAAALSVALVFGGGVALAQSDLIVDPWKRVLAGEVKAPAVPAAPEAGKAPREDSGWFDDETRAAGAPKPEPSKPVVEPSGPPLVHAPNPWVDAPARATPAAPVAPEAPRVLRASSWARVVPEIIDPWGPQRLVAYRDPLIVDPWAN